MDRIIFLDVDGVLNDMSPSSPKYDDTPTPRHIRPLKDIVDATGAKLVLTSSWRNISGLRAILDKALLDFGLTIADSTPELNSGRSSEIYAYLQKHPEIKSFLILDDDDWQWDNYLRSRWVQTLPMSGLLPRHVANAIAILTN